MENESQENKPKSYKFKELKVYSSTEWLADNKKKYRQVFDRHDTSYIYTELSFFNKRFDEESWKVKVNIKCFDISNDKKEVCNLTFEKKVSKFDNVVYIREGWGNKKNGTFWKKGTYFWEAWIDGEMVSLKYFYIEDAGQSWSFAEKNPFFDVKSLRLYEGKYDDVLEEERRYMKVFSREETRYIYAEVVLENNMVNVDWYLELFVKFNNEAKELKGQVSKLVQISSSENEIKITAGWGSNAPGSWRNGKYSLDIVFFNKLVATIPFDIGEEFQEGNNPIGIAYKNDIIEVIPTDDKESFLSVFSRLDQLIGLGEIKTKVKDHASYIQFLKIRKEKGFVESDYININAVFTGNPGTGKTTVAKMMGQLYKKMGLLKVGHVHEVDRVDLVGEYIGQTAPKVKEAIEKAKGGILFIDEAYALARSNDDTKDFGREVIEILVKAMSGVTQDFAVIVAGYPTEMIHFINSNPGLKSRFKHFFEFRDYLPTEMSAISQYASSEKDVTFTDEAQHYIDKLIIESYRSRDKSFGNARFVFDLVEKAKINLGLRIMKLKNPESISKDKLGTIELEDVKRIKASDEAIKPKIPIDEELLESSLVELNRLIGIDKVKKEIYELIDVIKFYNNQSLNVLNEFFFHTLFIGNPGTGKTTVARILAKIYKALGLLERGHIVETDRQGLVAGFVGQTAIKTNERIEEAMDGVLFIDEAYTLSNFNGLQGDFGNEAIQTLLKRMEDDRGQFFIFAAGYPKNMDVFLKANPGLKSRFDKVLIFDDYTVDELFSIAELMIQEKKYAYSEIVKTTLKTMCSQLNDGDDTFFGNARAVRKLVSAIIHNQNLRIAKSDKKSKSSMRQIIQNDLKELNVDTNNSLHDRPKIGF